MSFSTALQIQNLNNKINSIGQGFTGATGATGSSGGGTGAGYTGARGYTGYTGYTGARGDTGYTGASGVSYTGTTGYTGYTGARGDTGYTGTCNCGTGSYLPLTGGTMAGSINMSSNSIRYNNNVNILSTLAGGGSINIGNTTTLTNTAGISIGYDTGLNQSPYSVALGFYAGSTNQGLTGSSSVAIGEFAGYQNAGSASISVGQNAGKFNSGTNSIAIGKNASVNNSPDASIVINASGTVLNGNGAGLFIDPIRTQNIVYGQNSLFYDTLSKEIFSAPSSVESGIVATFQPSSTYLADDVNSTQTTIAIGDTFLLQLLVNCFSVIINSELITFSSIDTVNNILIGCTRGVNGSRPTGHPAYSTVYCPAGFIGSGYLTPSNPFLGWTLKTQKIFPANYTNVDCLYTSGAYGYPADNIVANRSYRVNFKCNIERYSYLYLSDIGGFYTITPQYNFSSSPTVWYNLTESYVTYLGNDLTTAVTEIDDTISLDLDGVLDTTGLQPNDQLNFRHQLYGQGLTNSIIILTYTPQTITTSAGQAYSANNAKITVTYK